MQRAQGMSWPNSLSAFGECNSLNADPLSSPTTPQACALPCVMRPSSPEDLDVEASPARLRGQARRSGELPGPLRFVSIVAPPSASFTVSDLGRFGYSCRVRRGDVPIHFYLMRRWLRRVGSGLLGLGIPMAARVDLIPGADGAQPTHLIVLLHGTCCQPVSPPKGEEGCAFPRCGR